MPFTSVLSISFLNVIKQRHKLSHSHSSEDITRRMSRNYKCSFMTATLLILSSNLSVETVHETWRTVVRSAHGKNQSYVVHDKPSTFHEAIEWCSKLGGQLPIIHYQEDFDFLMNTVIGKDSEPISEDHTWLGRKPVSNEVVCTTPWMDDTPVDFSFAYDSGHDCGVCQAFNCCASTVKSGGTYFKKIHMHSCSSNSRKVCVIQEDFIKYLEDTLHNSFKVSTADSTLPTSTSPSFQTTVDVLEEATELEHYDFTHLIKTAVFSVFLTIVVIALILKLLLHFEVIDVKQQKEPKVVFRKEECFQANSDQIYEEPILLTQ